ncbi:MAG: adenylate/guanylate cyclase domain-containing protein [Candidatus Rokubacteria bacterium]|nr:adenylate/guanylate cyclase domain-containing protein [Candidatus Rokubacteria bacterium]
MARVPETQYARCGNLHIAYQVVGEGPPDLVVVPGVVSHLEHQWDEPLQAAFFRRLASFSRLIRFDKRGQGLSDRVEHMPTIEDRMDDVRAVMDAAGSARAAILTLSEGGPMGIVFAATHPGRTSKLILWNTFARMAWAPGATEGRRQQTVDATLRRFEDEWGTGGLVSLFVPSAAADPSFRDWWARFERLSMSPGAAVEAMRVNFEIDVRDILPSVRVSTLVLRNAGDILPRKASRYLADQIPGARWVELPGSDHFAWREEDGVTQEIEEFLTGERTEPEIERILATILLTDIVGSTDRAAGLGDHRWRELLNRHDALVERALGRFRGRLVDKTGDGVLATFDGPARAIRCATTIAESVRGIGLEIRAGIHTGEVETRGDRLAGIAVHTASRVSSLAGPGEVLVSSTVKDLVAGSGIRFADRGRHVLKGVPGEWHLFATM